MKKPELLAPAGNLEKLKVAIEYGADSVYAGLEGLNLRRSADNFSIEELKYAADYVRSRGRKLHVAVNAFAHNRDIDELLMLADKLKNIDADSYIISDPGIIAVMKEKLPQRNLTLSTQANCSNYKSAAFWYEQGVKRIILARELTFPEIKALNDLKPPGLETEIFVHGAMCMSYSGRCLLSSYMTERSSNSGACSHPCRWEYQIMEESRQGEYFPVYEDSFSSSIFSSKDLMLIEYIPQIIQSAVSCIKIEGRMKSAYYVAVTVSCYRKALDLYFEDPETYELPQELLEELDKISHRPYFPGFFDPDNKDIKQTFDKDSYVKKYTYLGLVRSYDIKTGYAEIEQQNKINIGDKIEIISPEGISFSQKVVSMTDQDAKEIESAPHAKQLFRLKTDKPVNTFDIIRKKKVL